MWTTQIQRDSWVNLGGNGMPDDWVRLSTINRMRMVVGAANAVCTLQNGDQVATSYTVAQLIKIIADTSGSETAK